MINSEITTCMIVSVHGKPMLHTWDFDPIRNWLKENIQTGYSYSINSSGFRFAEVKFERKDDATIFRLFWFGDMYEPS